MFSALWAWICLAVRWLCGRSLSKPPVVQPSRRLPKVRQVLDALVADAVTMGSRSLGQNEVGILGQLRSKTRAILAQDAVILVLDLSTSIRGISEAYARGYTKYIDSLRDSNPLLILIGFDTHLRLLYQGPLANAPRYTAAHFSRHTPESLLKAGTALYRAILMGALLAAELSQKLSVTVNWLTDGLDSAEQERNAITLPMASTMCAMLQRLKISYRVIGILNPCYGSPAELDHVLARLNPAVVPTAEQSPTQTVKPDEAFLLASKMAKRNISLGSKTEIDLGE